jgi:hypothetical protein
MQGFGDDILGKDLLENLNRYGKTNRKINVKKICSDGCGIG